MEARLEGFRAANTQVLGVSVDSVYSHANWARDLGGISFPLLADFHPKGEFARSLGLYLDGGGITDRATVIATSDGIVRHASSVTPSGKRDIDELVELCKKIDSESSSKVEPWPAPASIEAKLYVKSNCGFSRAALLARDNLHLQGKVEVCNVTENEALLGELEKTGGKSQAPCLVRGESALYESKDIIATMVDAAAPV